MIFLVILNKPELINRYRDYINDLDIESFNNLLLDDEQFIIYKYIQKYIENYGKKSPSIIN